MANFKTEQLDMTIDPESKGMRIISLRSPLYVRGTFKQPDAGVKTVPLLARGAGMLLLGTVVAPAAGLLALVAPSGERENQCAQLLQQLPRPGKEPRQTRQGVQPGWSNVGVPFAMRALD